MLRGAAQALLARVAERVDRKRGWDSLGRLPGGVTLYGLRHQLRQRNLYDTPASDPPKREQMPARATVRTLDGSNTDVWDPPMGAAGTYFGRNGPAMPPRGPSPEAREVSERLLARRTFLPATSLNLLAAAWVQFEVHDWMQHRIESDRRSSELLQYGPGEGPDDPLELADGSTKGLPRYVSEQTHWWDASQLYGWDESVARELRTDDDTGRVKTGKALLSTIEGWADRRTPPVPNLWLGLALFHDLFAREHNAICDALGTASPQLEGDALYDKARLINAAVMAKIHTVEWTPAVVGHPTTAHAIRATWWGVLGERVRKRWGRVGSGEVLSGIPGSRTHHDGVRYSLTEEFVAVYRMHPLIPDEVAFFRAKDGKPIRLDGESRLPFEQLAAAGHPERPRELLDDIEFENAFYSLGVANPGVISLHNVPQFLRQLPTPHGDRIDVAERDIARSRECALPFYNDFRRVFRLAPVRSFLELASGDQTLAREIQDVYDDRLENVDAMVGLFAENKPRGFAFSDTAFRVFLLMAARRLRSDRFFTTDFSEDVYTATGLRWIDQATLARVLARHFPDLRPALERVGDDVFMPWPWMAGASGCG